MIDDDSLSHVGVKGMRWGVRRGGGSSSGSRRGRNPIKGVVKRYKRLSPEKKILVQKMIALAIAGIGTAALNKAFLGKSIEIGRASTARILRGP